ncbi:ABC-2 type transport system permease protein [Natrinema hispanicum]|uniref:ABC-2 type transport system permease protein n=1 Tax=Natrinema hispanicum TaxID=392421 RepID=A0A482Y2F1_9EURY|nr:ABC transporter permease [Natrinema hispanicum]RZV06222.1 ABC-2 type transport system permease protein [Natrinema hispanicum]
MRVRRVLAIAKKDIRIYYTKGPVLISGLLLPVFFFLAFTMGRDMAGTQLVAGLIGMTLWFTATSISPVIAPWETRDGTLERLVSAPITVVEILLGDIVASATISVIITGVATAILALVLDVSIANPVLIGVGLILAAIGFSALGVLLAAVPTDQTSNVMMLATLVKFSIIFVSGIFVPVADLPSWGRVVAYGSPLTYLVQTTKYGLGTGDSAIIWLVGLLFFFIITFSLAVSIHRKTLPKRL